MGFPLQTHRRVRMRGYDLREYTSTILQTRTLREHGHAPGILPWYHLYCQISRATRALTNDARAFSNVYPGMDKMLSRKYRVGRAGWAYFLRMLEEGVGTPVRRVVVATTSETQTAAADGIGW